MFKQQKPMKKTGIIVLLLVAIIACRKEKELDKSFLSSNKLGLKELEYDYSDKDFGATNIGPNNINQKVILGRVLFYDKQLSFNNNISCGTCHKQDFGFADNVKIHKGIWGTDLQRNTLSISGEANLLFWDGRSQSLSDLVLRPIANHQEMLQDLSVLPEKLKKMTYYKQMFKNAFGDSTITIERIGNALSFFCRAIQANNSKINKMVIAGNNTSMLSNEEKAGYDIFNGKGRCVTCHSFGSISSYNSAFHNIGLDIIYKDGGLSNISNREEDKGVFKTPNLTNIELTAPYMHDGRYNTLEEVVEFYNSQIQAHPNLSSLLKDEDNHPLRLQLTDSEKNALVKFLKTFTDPVLKTDPRFSDPFVY
jgi:cytochrome c peroxidase